MNEEYFLTELSIYLKPLPTEKKEEIIASYRQLFQEGVTAGLAEEVIAKDLGKPKDLAAEILKEFHITFQDKKIYQNGWQEFQPRFRTYEGPRFDENDYIQSQNEDFSYEKDYSSYQNANNLPLGHGPLVKILLVLFNLFIMIWLVLTVFFALVAAWLTVAIFLASPFISLVFFFSLPTSIGLFQLAISIILFGLGLLGIVIGRPITSFFTRLNREYWQFNRKIFHSTRGGLS